MHSSRMRTASSLTVSRSIWRVEVYLPGGVPAQGVYLPGGVYLTGGCTYLGVCTCPGVYLPGGVLAWGVYLPRGCT